MKSTDDFDESKRLATQILKLFFFLMLAGVGLYYAESYWTAKRTPEGQFSIFLMIFGSIHILFSDALSFLYNLQKKIIPFAPAVTPSFLRLLGVVLFCGGVGFLLYYINKAV